MPARNVLPILFLEVDLLLLVQLAPLLQLEVPPAPPFLVSLVSSSTERHALYVPTIPYLLVVHLHNVQLVYSTLQLVSDNLYVSSIALQESMFLVPNA